MSAAGRRGGGAPPRRPLEAVRAGWGAVLLVAPRQLLTALGDRGDDRRAVAVVRVLGARHVVQAAASGLAPGPAVLAAGTWVDAVHALTAVALAAVDRRRARLALLDAALAGTWSAASRRDLARTPATAGRGSWAERAARAVLPLLPGAPRPAGR